MKPCSNCGVRFQNHGRDCKAEDEEKTQIIEINRDASPMVQAFFRLADAN